MHYTVHAVESAPAEAQPHLAKSLKAYGFIPNLHAVMAEAPTLLEAYREVSAIFDMTSFSPAERQVVLLAASAENACTYCMAAHSTIASMQKVPADTITALRAGTPIADPKLEALRRFTEAMVRSRGRPDPAEVATFFAAGYGKQQLFEVIVGVGLKTLSNYTNHIADTPLDAGFAPQAWARAAE